MSLLDAGQRRNLTARFKKAVVATTIVASLVVGDLAMLGVPVIAGGETRTIQLYHIHTGENINVTYMQNGKYVPSAMKKINYLLRDWRKNKVITIDPRSIDLVWELHEDLGSNRPIHIVCGYRSPQTNAFLKRIGRNVAKHSQHMGGKAIDFYFPDVPTVKIRNSALVRKVGGVGYYRSSGGPTGFLHVDSGHVRHWGPAISNSQMAQIFREGAKTVGRRMRLNRNNDTIVAPDDGETKSGSGSLLAAIFGKKKSAAEAPTQVAVAEPVVAPIAPDYSDDEGDMAALAGDAATPPPAPKVVAPFKVAQPTPIAEVIPPEPELSVPKDQMAKLNALAADATVQAADDGSNEPLVRKGYPVPKPRLRPPEILLAAAANIKADPKFIRISPVNDGPPDLSGNNQPSPVSDSLGTVMAASAQPEDSSTQKPTRKTKGTFAAELRTGVTDDAPVIKPLFANAAGGDINWWPQLFLNGEAAIRRDGAPAMIGAEGKSPLPEAVALGAEGVSSGNQTTAEGKGDLLVVNREGKGDLEASLAPLNQKVGQLVTQ